MHYANGNYAEQSKNSVNPDPGEYHVFILKTNVWTLLCPMKKDCGRIIDVLLAVIIILVFITLWGNQM